MDWNCRSPWSACRPDTCTLNLLLNHNPSAHAHHHHPSPHTTTTITQVPTQPPQRKCPHNHHHASAHTTTTTTQVLTSPQPRKCPHHHHHSGLPGWKTRLSGHPHPLSPIQFLSVPLNERGAILRPSSRAWFLTYTCGLTCLSVVWHNSALSDMPQRGLT